jgi:hypothetical protein
MTHSPEVRQQFEILWANRKPMDEIASTLSNVPLSTLKKWVKTKGNLVPLKSPGRSEKLNERDVRHLVSKAKRNPSLSIKSVTEHAGLSICHSTAVKYLKTANLCSIVAVKKPKRYPRTSNLYRIHAYSSLKSMSKTV